MLGCPGCSNCNGDVYTYFCIPGARVLLGLICHALTDILIDIFLLLAPHSSYQPGWPPPPPPPSSPHTHTIKEAERLGNFFALISVGSKYRRTKINEGGFLSRNIHIYLFVLPPSLAESFSKRTLVLKHLRVSCVRPVPEKKRRQVSSSVEIARTV